jgi:hypothetical protein
MIHSSRVLEPSSVFARARLFGPILLVLTGCSSYGALCEAAGECDNSNDLDIEACVNAFETEAEVASIYGCDEEFDEYVICLEEEGRCRDDEFEAEDCGGEAEDYGDCVD